MCHCYLIKTVFKGRSTDCSESQQLDERGNIYFLLLKRPLSLSGPTTQGWTLCSRGGMWWSPHRLKTSLCDFLPWFSFQGLLCNPLPPLKRGSGILGPSLILKVKFLPSHIVPFSFRKGGLPTMSVKFCILSKTSYELFIYL